jgi:hypothetical protein
MNYKVYLIRRISTKKVVYVGITKGSLNSRFSKHLKDFRRNPRKSNYFKKYLLDLEICLIEDNIKTLEDANMKEIHYISKYKQEYGDLLNATQGGDGTKGFPSWNKGKSCEYIDKLILNSPRAKRVFMYNDKGNYLDSFNSIKKACEKTQIPRCAIQKMAEERKSFKTYKGYTFRFYQKDKIEINKMSHAQRLEIVKESRNKSAKQVLIYDKMLGEYIQYKNVKECSKKLLLKTTSIYSYCNIKKETSKYIFSYV